MSGNAASGVIVLDKPAGCTSNGALGRIKRALGVRKAGFLGTLDPLATGVLPVFVGKATKLIAGFEGLDKTYRVTLRLGERTDTLDAEGTVLERRDTGHLRPGAVEAAVLAFQGTLEQDTPAYAATKHGGVPAYKLARAGREVPARRRTVRLWDAAVEAVALPEVTFRVTCSAGTYMRQLGADIGGHLGVGATLTALRRLRSGGPESPFRVERAVTPEAVEAACARGGRGFLLNPGEVIADHVPYAVTGEEERQLRQGRPLTLDAARMPEARPGRVKALRPDGTLVAVGAAVPARWGRLSLQPEKVLV